MRNLSPGDHPLSGLRGIADHSWHRRGRCHGLAPATADHLFFPRPRDRAAIARAKALCGACPVRQLCLTTALDTNTKEGIWGGLTETERRPFHEKVEHRLDYARIHAVFNGRDIRLSTAERATVARHAAGRGWGAERLARLLRVDVEWARDLLRDARKDITDRDLYWAVHQQAEEDGVDLMDLPDVEVPPQRHTHELVESLREAA
ncbi:WhiB family transcriptional regulator [Streptomyces sp. WAC 06783]|uniref:WhiB family transcriptional regulator n=1 Tax=Streptomyces sp. WAC 06783 TaxID=2203211 RepID=UPI000F73BE12|nr:WhiB family transcriptional regulator [Streptomyces sp. WAC 06783]RSO07010.1 WhiB family transcriptional regulator [Streptomyces sp. WAC 06783]